MTSSKWFLGLGIVLWAACTPPASGALGPQGYEQSVTKYRLNYADGSNQKFLPGDWVLDNYAYDGKKWKEKKGVQYRAERQLDEDGDGTIASNEKKEENLFDLRFVNSRDNAAIWLKVHPLQPTYANVDLDVILEGYVDGLEGTGLFEQSTLFGLAQDKARHFTTFMVKKEATALGSLPAIRGVVEIADVDKLRFDRAHRDSKAELVFAKVTYLEKLGISRPSAPRWPVVSETNGNGQTVYSARRTGLLVIGYYDDASRFESHAADFHALLGQLVIPDSAVPPNSVPFVLPKERAPAASASAASAPASSAATTTTTTTAAPAPAPAPTPATTPTSSAAISAAPSEVPVPTTSAASKAPPAAVTPVPSSAKK